MGRLNLICTPTKPIKTSEYSLSSMIFEVTAIPAGEVVSELAVFANTIRPLLLQLSLIAGGVAGLYVILLILRVHYERKKVKLLEAIRYDLDNLNIHFGVSHSLERRGLVRRVWARLFHSPESVEPENKKPVRKNEEVGKKK